MKFINDYPYTNMTAQNIDWLIKAVVDLIHQGKTDEEIKNAPGISEAYGAFCNAYPYTNMTMQNIDWLISAVRELYDKEATLEENITKIEAQIATLQADVANLTTKLDNKVDKTTEPSKIYGTDPDGMPFFYTQTATETTLYSVPLRNENGAIVAAAAQQGNEVVNLTQMDTALEDKVSKTTARQIVYARDSAGNESALSYDSEATVGVAVRGENGVLKVGTPVANDDATTKKYVDDGLAGKVDKTTEPAKIYGTDASGEPHLYEQNATEIIPWSLPMRNGTGALVAANPTLNNELTTKEYVDNAIKTAPTGGWTTILDKTWTEDETSYRIDIDIPVEYQKAMSELEMTYYNDTPQAGAVYSVKNVDIRLYDGVTGRRFMDTNNILPTQDTKEITVKSYAPPTIPTFTAERYNASGVKDSAGTYAKAYAEFWYTNVYDGTDDLNSVTAKLYYTDRNGQRDFIYVDSHTWSNLFGGGFTIDNSHTITLVVTDVVGGETRKDFEIMGTTYLLDFLPGGNGVGIGCEATTSGQLDVGFNTLFKGGTNTFEKDTTFNSNAKVKNAIYTGNKTAWNDGVAGAYIGKDGTVHLSGTNTNIAFHANNVTSG